MNQRIPMESFLASGVKVLEMPFGSSRGKAGFANGPDHTPYPEGPQSIQVRANVSYVADTFNGRLLLNDLVTGKLSGTISPTGPFLEGDHTYYTNFLPLSGSSVLGIELINRKIFLLDPSGKASQILGDTQLGDVTGAIAGPDGSVYLGDKGGTEGRVLVLDGNLALRGILRLPGLTEQGFGVGPKGIVMAPEPENMALRAFFPKSGSLGSFDEPRRIEIRTSYFPAGGGLKVAGIDAKDRIFVYWAGLKEYLSPEFASILSPEAKAAGELQPVAIFNVFDLSGNFLGGLTAPMSTAMESACIGDDGYLYVMAYDAARAPEGGVTVYRYNL